MLVVLVNDSLFDEACIRRAEVFKARVIWFAKDENLYVREFQQINFDERE